MHRTGELFGQFETMDQQRESASLGMWVFLVTEVLFFGGMFMTYTLNRSTYPDVFARSQPLHQPHARRGQHGRADRQQLDDGHVRMGFAGRARRS